MGGDTYPTVRVAAVQAAPVFLDREATVDKACELIAEASRGGARLIAFPEGFIPTHPIWYHHHPATGRIANRLAVELFENALEVPGADFERLCGAAVAAGAYVVMGACEKTPGSIGTMFNTQLIIGPDGGLLGRHVKIVPTVGERMVHTGGYGDTMRAVPTEFGPISGLICAENSNPLAAFTMIAQRTRFHIAAWPGHFPPGAHPMRIRVSVDSRAFAQMSGAFVIAACGTVDEATITRLEVGTGAEAFLRNPDSCGGSMIVAPNQEILAGPMGPEEGILYADCDLRAAVASKIRHDFAGHSGRPDIFHLQVNTARPSLLEFIATPLPGEPAAHGETGTPVPPGPLPGNSGEEDRHERNRTDDQ